MYTRDFFISYTHADLQWARWIAWELKEANYSYVVQEEHFVPGQDFIQRMRTALQECRHVIAVLSPDYFQSEFATAELNAALRSDPLGVRARLIPIRVRDCQLDEMLKARVYINLVGKRDAAVLRHDLITGIEAARSTVLPDDQGMVFDQPVHPPIAAEEVPAAVPTGSLEGGRSPRVNVLFLGLEIGRGLQLRAQMKGIRRILARTRRTGPFRVKGLLDATAEDLPDILAKEAPQIVHFSGNQNGGRVLIRSSAGGVTTIPASAVRGMMQTLDGTVRLAVIDTCDSLPCAREVATSVDVTLGVSGKPYDSDAIRFYETFYRALAAGRSVAAAYEQSVAAHKLRGISRSETPKLCVRKGIDPAEVHFRR